MSLPPFLRPFPAPFAALLLLAASSSGAPPPAPAALPPDAAAVVDGTVIPRSLVDAFVTNGREALGLDPRTDEGRATLTRLHAAVIEELIERSLVSAGARERGVAADDAALADAERRGIILHGNPGRYAEFVRRNGFATPAEYREKVLRPGLDGERLAEALGREVSVTDDEVRDYYEAHRGEAEFQSPERVTAAHILINAQPGALSSYLERTRNLAPGTPEMAAALAEETQRRRQLAETVRAEAAAPGADFAALAKKYSEDLGTREVGGSLGSFARGTHPAALDDMLFTLREPGEIGPVVQTEFGFHVARLLARVPAGTRTLAEADSLIRPRLLRVKQAERLREWLRGRRAGAVVIVAPDPAG